MVSKQNLNPLTRKQQWNHFQNLSLINNHQAYIPRNKKMVMAQLHPTTLIAPISQKPDHRVKSVNLSTANPVEARSSLEFLPRKESTHCSDYEYDIGARSSKSTQHRAIEKHYERLQKKINGRRPILSNQG